MAGKYMLADKGDSRPMKDMVKTMSFFCVCVKVEKGASVSRPVNVLPAVLSASSATESLVAFSLLGCVLMVVEAGVALVCCMIDLVPAPSFCNNFCQ
jgi:hypothetical protein